MQLPKIARIRKAYESPTLRKLNPEEAKQVLFQHVEGDSGAKEVLALVLSGNENARQLMLCELERKSGEPAGG